MSESVMNPPYTRFPARFHARKLAKPCLIFQKAALSLLYMFRLNNQKSLCGTGARLSVSVLSQITRVSDDGCFVV